LRDVRPTVQRPTDKYFSHVSKNITPYISIIFVFSIIYIYVGTAQKPLDAVGRTLDTVGREKLRPLDALDGRWTKSAPVGRTFKNYFSLNMLINYKLQTTNYKLFVAVGRLDAFSKKPFIKIKNIFFIFW